MSSYGGADLLPRESVFMYHLERQRTSPWSRKTLKKTSASRSHLHCRYFGFGAPLRPADLRQTQAEEFLARIWAVNTLVFFAATADLANLHDVQLSHWKSATCVLHWTVPSSPVGPRVRAGCNFSQIDAHTPPQSARFSIRLPRC
jgi:hypothetical protein